MLLGFLADAHGNVEAFLVGIEVLKCHGVDQMYFLGDAVGYLPGGSVVEEIYRLSIPSVMGNHEAMLLGLNVMPPSKEPTYRLDETKRSLDDETLGFIAGWPDQREVATARGPLLLVHGSPDDPVFGYVYADTELPFDSLVEPPAAVFMSATHRPFVRAVNGVTYVNVGSCGLPRDCGRLGSVGLFDAESGVTRILRFDITSATLAALQRCGPIAPEVLAVMERHGDCFGEHV